MVKVVEGHNIDCPIIQAVSFIHSPLTIFVILVSSVLDRPPTWFLTIKQMILQRKEIENFELFY